MKMLLASMVVVMLVGCASTGDIETLQSQVDALKLADGESVDKSAAMCVEHCAKGEKQMNDKLDSLFKKSMTK